MNNEKPKQSALKVFSNNFSMLKIALKAAPFYTLHVLFDGLQGRFIIFMEHVYMIGYIINAITYNEPFYKPALFLLIVFLYTTLYNTWHHFTVDAYGEIANQKIIKQLRLKIYTKAAAMDLKCYDDPDFYNDFVWAINEAGERINKVINTISNLLGGIGSLLFIGGYMISQDSLGIVVVFISFVGVFTISTIKNKMRIKIREEMRPKERQREYISRIFYLADHASEIRLSNVKDKLYKKFDEAYDSLNDTACKKSWPLVALGILQFIFSDLLVDVFYLLWLMYRTIVMGAFKYGTMIILYNSCGQIRRSFFTISRALPELQENSMYIDKIRKFLDYEIAVKSPEKPLTMPKENEDIVLKNVCFGYGEKKVLKNLNLTIKKGEKIALVGYNGAGKTTLVKLLMRLYDVSSGEILYGGKNIKEYDIDDYRGAFQTVFQDYQIFAASVRENIVMDTAPPDEEKLKNAIEKGGFAKKLSKLENGLDTQLTREFDDNGCLLSGGETQALVTSRAFYADSRIIILDEPSSALDPIAEYNLNKSVLSLGSDKTVVTISHRLSTTKLADKIYMIENGVIIEQGTHDELMSIDGKYAEMFNLQAEKYRMQV